MTNRSRNQHFLVRIEWTMRRCIEIAEKIDI